MFKTLREKLSVFKKKASEEINEEGEGKVIATITGRVIREGKIDDVLWDLELILLESDVALPVIEAIKENLKEELVGKVVKKRGSIESIIEDSLRNAITKVLSANTFDFDALLERSDRPLKIMFVGVNGTGKTTAIAKIAYYLKSKGKSCVIAASDTFRAGAIEQLERHAEKLGVKLIKHKAGSDPAAVAYDAIEHAKARGKDVVLIDTAGRMQTNVNLMDEMRKIKRVCNPDVIMFVGDALAGNDAVDQAKKFNEAVGIDAVILTKIDTDAKGGAALSVTHAVGKPIAFIGVGQGYEDMIPFDTDWMVSRLFAEEGSYVASDSN